MDGGGWATQTSHTTTLPDEVTRPVTITDPTHPLFGQVFPLVRSSLRRGLPVFSSNFPTAIVALCRGRLLWADHGLPCVLSSLSLTVFSQWCSRWRILLQSLLPLPTSTSQPPATSALSAPPRLWPYLTLQHQQQLAYRLADLIRRIHTAAPTTSEVRHD